MRQGRREFEGIGGNRVTESEMRCVECLPRETSESSESIFECIIGHLVRAHRSSVLGITDDAVSDMS